MKTSRKTTTVPRPIKKRSAARTLQTRNALTRTKKQIALQATTPQESEQRFLQIFQTNPIAVLLSSLDNGSVLDANPSFSELTGYPLEEILGRTTLALGLWQDYATRARFLAEFKSKGRLHHLELPLRTRSGEIRETLRFIEPITLFNQSCALTYIIDISERKRAEEEIRRRADELSALNVLGRQISASLSPERVITSALEEILSAVRPDIAYLFLREGERLILNRVVPESVRARLGEIPEHRVGECMCGLAVSLGEAIYSRDIFADARCTWDECKQAGFRSFAALPLRHGDECIGVIGLASNDERDFERQSKFLETLSDQIEIGLQNAILFEQSVRRSEQLAALHQTTLEITATRNLNELLGAIVERALTLIAAPGGALFLCDEENRTVRCVVSHNQPRDYIGTMLRYGEGVAGKTAATGNPLILKDYQTFPDKAEIYRNLPTRAMLSIPIFWHDQVIGVLQAVDSSGTRQFSSTDQEHLTLFAQQAAVAIQNARLLESEHNARMRAEILSAAYSALAESLDLDVVLDTLLKHLQVLVPYDSGNVMLLENEQFATRAIRGYENWTDPAFARAFRFDPREYPHFREIIETRQPMVVSDTAHLSSWKPISGTEHVRAWLGVPLIAGGQVVGLYSMDSTRPNSFTPEHIQNAVSLAAQAAVAIQNARLLESERALRAQLQILSSRLLEAQETERRAIARELHDEIGQGLTAIKINLQSALRLGGATALTQSLADCIRTTEGVLDQVRTLSLDLHPSLLDDLGLVAALRWLVDRQAHDAGFSAHFVVEPLNIDLPTNIEVTCFRVAQEALTNIARHAHAHNVYVELHQTDAELELHIRDDGVGFDVTAARVRARAGSSLGLMSMEERILLAGGKFEIRSESSRGTEIRACLPVHAAGSKQE